VKQSLFKKIFIKHLTKRKEPLTKFAEDIGHLKGIFSFKGTDIHTGKVISEGTFNNLVVNESKSAIIRLLGQGQSIYSGVIDPLQFRVSKMRFSNDTGIGDPRATAQNKLEYYAISEGSNRISVASNGIFGGGSYGSAICAAPENPSQDEYKHVFSNTFNNAVGLNGYVQGSTTNGKIFDLKSGIRPPSHGSVVVKLKKGTVTLEELWFDLKAETTEDELSIYTKDAFSNKPNRIINYKVDLGTGPKFYHITTPFSGQVTFTTSPDTLVRTTEIDSVFNYTGSRIYYDYTSTPVGWKIYIEETAETIVPPIYTQTVIAAGNNPGPSNNVWDKIEISYTTGLQNVINLIIPKSGYNRGYGTNQLIRYGNQDGDSYSTITPYYEDCADDYINDFSVTFTTSMSAAQGNGVNGGVNLLQYTKAFLFTENEHMFSSIVFGTSDFTKNSSNSYQVSWKILAPVN